LLVEVLKEFQYFFWVYDFNEDKNIRIFGFNLCKGEPRIEFNIGPVSCVGVKRRSRDSATIFAKQKIPKSFSFDTYSEEGFVEGNT